MAKSKKRSAPQNQAKLHPSARITQMEEAKEQLLKLQADEKEEEEKASAKAVEEKPEQAPADAEKAEMYKILRRLMDDMGATSLAALSEMIDKAELSKLIRVHALDEDAAKLFLAQQEKVRALRQAELLAKREAEYAEMRQNPIYKDVDGRREAVEALAFRTGLSPRQAYNALFAEERLGELLAEAEKEAVSRDRNAKRIPALSGGAAPDQKASAGLSEAEAWAAARAGISRDEYAKYKYAYSII